MVPRRIPLALAAAIAAAIPPAASAQDLIALARMAAAQHSRLATVARQPTVFSEQPGSPPNTATSCDRCPSEADGSS